MPSELYTVGYEGADIAHFLQTMKDCGIKRLIDIRDVPVSRKRGFSKTALANALEERNIAYIHLKALGDPKAGREAMRRGDYPRFLEIYTAHIATPEGQAALRVAVKLATENPSILLCYERSPIQCHRTVVAKEMAVLADFNVKNVGINP
ncbi:DUF488 domain-containing protein [Sphingomonas sp. AP4-R1]|uniref:DUF488 domain-containing protein n=1 Tax=Sphingomonas sp. AP4-R1 TaxID=2735134 RepID=UPI0014934987|nr:DUF488 domain-containing protein [Sphingomonas sp. AP4-R1]QJU60260.1 DUF488 domain-containing protein [Sphingomonas sp. AP4-R1]